MSCSKEQTIGLCDVCYVAADVSYVATDVCCVAADVCCVAAGDVQWEGTAGNVTYCHRAISESHNVLTFGTPSVHTNTSTYIVYTAYIDTYIYKTNI
jgi:hypothetical protein